MSRWMRAGVCGASRCRGLGCCALLRAHLLLLSGPVGWGCLAAEHHHHHHHYHYHYHHPPHARPGTVARPQQEGRSVPASVPLQRGKTQTFPEACAQAIAGLVWPGRGLYG